MGRNVCCKRASVVNIHCLPRHGWWRNARPFRLLENPSRFRAPYLGCPDRFASSPRNRSPKSMITPSLAAVLVLALAFVLPCASFAADLKDVPLPPSELLAQGTAVTVAARTSFLEGPAVDASGDLYFSDIIGNRIYKMTPDGAVSVFRADSGRTNGNTFDAQGRLISCEGAEQGPGGRRRVVRTDLKTGVVEVLTDRFEGKRYNSPNDVCVDAKGRIWFTDPYYGEDHASLELDAEAVYRIDPTARSRAWSRSPRSSGPTAWRSRPTQDALRHRQPPPPRRQPQDLGLRPRGRRHPLKPAARLRLRPRPRRRRHAARHPGQPLGRRRHHPPAHRGRDRRRPPGRLRDHTRRQAPGRIPIPEDVITNLAFGGPDRKTLYVVAGKAIFKVRVAVEGYALYPPLRL